MVTLPSEYPDQSCLLPWLVTSCKPILSQEKKSAGRSYICVKMKPFIKSYSQNTIMVLSRSPLQILNGLNKHLDVVCEVIHVRLQEVHFLL